MSEIGWSRTIIIRETRRVQVGYETFRFVHLFDDADAALVITTRSLTSTSQSLTD